MQLVIVVVVLRVEKIIAADVVERHIFDLLRAIAALLLELTVHGQRVQVHAGALVDRGAELHESQAVGRVLQHFLPLLLVAGFGLAQAGREVIGAAEVASQSRSIIQLRLRMRIEVILNQCVL